MQYEPKTEDEIDRGMVLADGIYDFEVVNAEDTISKKGNDMIALELRVFVDDGSTRLLRDWLVGNGHGLSIRKIKHFSESVGLDYESGQISAALCAGKAGLVAIGSKEQEGYGLQNFVADYKTSHPGPAKPQPQGVSKSQQSLAANKTGEAPNPDDIPF